MESESEKLQLEIKGALYQLTVGQLTKICNALQISGPEEKHVTGKSRSQLISLITKHLEQEELTDLEDEGMSVLLNVQDIIDTIQNEIPNQTDEQEKNAESG